MSHKSKRYVLYDTYWSGLPYFKERYTCHPKWSRRTYTREQIVVEIAGYIKGQQNIEVRITDDINKVFLNDLVRYIPDTTSRPGVKRWKSIKVVWICIKIIRNGYESEVNVDSLIKEAETVSFRKRSCKNYKYHKCWKDQYKCKHQYDIHISNHIDTIK